jgi:hypothetical protein
MQAIAEHFDRARPSGSSRRRPTSPSASRAARGKSTRSARTCPAAEIFYCAARGLGRRGDQLLRVSGLLPRPRGRAASGSASRAAGIVDASATRDEEFLLGALETDDGARRLGEFGIGCNPGIQRHMRNTLFDEKMEGTIHLAIGTGFPQVGGQNRSGIHWDMVKDLRGDGRIELDGEVVQRQRGMALS